MGDLNKHMEKVSFDMPFVQQEKVQSHDYVKVNVGGCLFHTTRNTLTKQDTMLRAMFSGRLPVVTDSEGWILVDRSGKHFGLILDYLRDGSIPFPDCRFEVEQILREARYYLVQDLAAECQAWLDTHEYLKEIKEPVPTCSVPIVHTKAEADRLLLGSRKPAIKLLINRHNNKYSYTSQSDDNILKNLELFDRLAVKFHDRIFFVKDVGSESTEVCQWKFFGKNALRAEVCCTSIVYSTDKKQTKVDLFESRVYEEVLSILSYEDRDRDRICSRCRGEACLPGSAVSTPTSE